VGSTDYLGSKAAVVADEALRLLRRLLALGGAAGLLLLLVRPGIHAAHVVPSGRAAGGAAGGGCVPGGSGKFRLAIFIRNLRNA
jgi:hypothetical protein